MLGIDLHPRGPCVRRRPAACLATLGLPALAMLGGLLPAMADFPLPPFTYYGEVQNAYGQPYTQADKAQLIVRVAGRECGRTTLDERLGPGINYRVEVPLDNGQGALYASFAALPGDQPTFSVLLGTQEHVLLEAVSSPPIGTPGGRLRLSFVRDADSDHDGIPNTWMILSFGHATGLASDRTRPQDDRDGDGMSNLEEFLAGTDPTWDADRLEIDQLVYLPEVRRYGIGFLSVRGKSYQLLGAQALPAWLELDFSLAAPQSPSLHYWRGDGYYSWFYVDATGGPSQLFLLKAQ